MSAKVATAVSKSKSESRESESKRLPLFWRLLLSFLLAIHLLAVFIGPFTFATSVGPGMASPFAAPIRDALRPYLELAFLDHGYFFFAPNPGPSHLLRAKLEFADGRAPLVITLPDRKRQWPRLMYHRHFMLAEQLHSEFVPPELPPEAVADPVQYENWRRARSLFELRRTALEDHLRKAYHAQRVTLSRVEHELYGPGEFAAKRSPLDAPETYRELSEDAPVVPAIGLGGGS